MLAAGTAAAAPALLRWQTDVARPQPRDWEVFRGETVILAPVMTESGAGIDLSGSTCTLWYQTNGMADAWWTAAASTGLVAGEVRATWSPTNDCGAARYNYFVAAASPAGISYRAHGRLIMRHAPGVTPAVLAAPTTLTDAMAAWADSHYDPLGTAQAASNALAAAVQAEAQARASGDLVAMTNWQAVVYSMTNGAARGATALQPAATNGWEVGSHAGLLTPPATNTLAAAAAHAATAHGVTGDGGFQGGISAVEHGGAAAVGSSARASDGGGAVGNAAFSESGGGAVGLQAKTSSGFAGGKEAYATTDGTASGNGIDAIQLGTGGNKEPGTLQIYSNRLLNADGTIPVERLTLHDTNTLAHADIRGEIATATNELVQTYLLGTNAWMSISNAVLTIWRETNGVPSALWSSAESEGGGGVDPAFINAVWAALAGKADAAWGKYAPDGSANPEPAYMTFLNAPAIMHASGYQWATYGAYSVMAESGAVAFESGADGSARWGLDLHTNYVGFVRGGSVIVAARAGAITVTDGGTTNGVAEIAYPYTSGDFPSLWYAPTLDVPFTLQPGVVWIDNQDGTATVTAPATAPKGFWYATTTSTYDVIFDIRPPARLTGGVIGATNVLPVVYDSVITVTSGAKTYRIPAQEVP